MAACDPTKSIMKWTAVIIAVGTIAAGLVTVSSTYVFATKKDLTLMEKRQTRARSGIMLRDYRIEKLEVQMGNLENIARRTDLNVEKLLIQRQIEPGPAPIAEALPPMPDLEALNSDDLGD